MNPRVTDALSSKETQRFLFLGGGGGVQDYVKQ